MFGPEPRDIPSFAPRQSGPRIRAGNHTPQPIRAFSPGIRQPSSGSTQTHRQFALQTHRGHRKIKGRVRNFRSTSARCVECISVASVAQWIEHFSPKEGVVGSIPIWGTLFKTVGPAMPADFLFHPNIPMSESRPSPRTYGNTPVCSRTGIPTSFRYPHTSANPSNKTSGMRERKNFIRTSRISGLQQAAQIGKPPIRAKSHQATTGSTIDEGVCIPVYMA